MSFWNHILEKILRIFGKRSEVVRTARTLSQTEAAAAGPHPFAIKRIPVALTVGLDYGTHTVKSIVTAFIGERRRREQHVISIDGYNLFPSVAWVTADQLSIGLRPEGTSRALRSVKVCLRCGILQGEPCRKCFDNNYLLTAELVAWATIAHCVNCIRKEINAKYPHHRYQFNWDTDVEWNMGVPLDGLEQRKLYNLFCDLLWRAVHHGSTVQRSNQINHLCSAYASLQSVHCPARSESNCFVISEADVAVNAFLKEHHLEDGLYFICDMGAGTLDVAFFRFAQDQSRPIVFYGTSSVRVGGDQFAHTLIEQFQGQDEDARYRRAEELMLSGFAGISLGPQSYDGKFRIFESVYGEIAAGRVRAFRRAYLKETLWSRWQGIRGTLIGGGVRIPGVTSECLGKFSYGNVSADIHPKEIRMRFERLLGATSLHGIAYGLSIPIAEHFESWHPEEISPLETGIARKRDPLDDPYAK